MTGAGASVEHLCDNDCIKGSHLHATARHVSNLERQRCVGAILIVKNGVILQVKNCPHMQISADGKIEVPMCTRFHVVELDFEPEHTQEYLNARAAFELNRFGGDSLWRDCRRRRKRWLCRLAFDS